MNLTGAFNELGQASPSANKSFSYSDAVNGLDVTAGAPSGQSQTMLESLGVNVQVNQSSIQGVSANGPNVVAQAQDTKVQATAVHQDASYKEGQVLAAVEGKKNEVRAAISASGYSQGQIVSPKVCSVTDVVVGAVASSAGVSTSMTGMDALAEAFGGPLKGPALNEALGKIKEQLLSAERTNVMDMQVLEQNQAVVQDVAWQNFFDQGHSVIDLLQKDPYDFEEMQDLMAVKHGAEAHIANANACLEKAENDPSVDTKFFYECTKNSLAGLGNAVLTTLSKVDPAIETLLKPKDQAPVVAYQLDQGLRA